VTTASGKVVTDQIASWNTDITGKTFSITTVSGETVTTAITGWKSDLANNTLSVTVADGSPEGQTITSTIKSWTLGEGPNGSHTITINTDAGPVTTEITSAVTAADGQSVTVQLKDGTSLTLQTAIQTAVTPEAPYVAPVQTEVDNTVQTQLD